MGPDRIENEKQLDKDTTEWKDTAHDDARNRLRVEDLLWNLTLDGISANRMLNWSLFVAIESSKECERDGDSEPEEENHNERSKRNGYLEERSW